MNNDERDKRIIETHQDVKWIKEWIATQNKYKLMIWGALIMAVLSLITR